MDKIKEALIFLMIAFLCAGCITAATYEELEQAKVELADQVEAVTDAIIDVLPLPIPKDATKEMISWLSDIAILGGAGGAIGVAGIKKARKNGKKSSGAA